MKKIDCKFLVIVFILFVYNCTYNVYNCFSQSGWVLQPGITGNQLSGIYFINPQTGYTAGFYGTILKTTNSGLNWITLNSGTSQSFISVTFLNDQTGWCYGGSWNGGTSYMIKTTNAGQSWNTVFSSNIGCFSEMVFVSPDIGFLTTSKGYILKTIDSGMSWNTNYTNFSFWYINCYFVNQNTGWVIGYPGYIIKTTDCGNNWFTQNSNTSESLTGIYFTSANTGFISGYNGTILKTTNGGQNWISKTSGTSLWLCWTHFADSSTGWAVGGNIGNTTSVILRTNNGGENWTTQNSPANSRLTSVKFTNTSTGYAVGTSGTILMTTNGGLMIPSAPVLTAPPNNSVDISVTPTLQWNQSAGATSYKVQISSVANFFVITDSATVTTNQYVVPSGKLSGGYTYFWRVNASNSSGTSPWSAVWSFSTSIYPPAPVLLSPLNGFIGTTVTPTLKWNYISGVTSYLVQISTVPNFTVITDSSTIDTNQYVVPSGKLSLNITYFWRVNAKNNYGTSSWSSVWSFTPQPTGISITSTEIPRDFKLYQNYPNPFNPATTVKFDLPKNDLISLTIYNSLGQVVENLYKGSLTGGTYSLSWNASKYNSGIYFIRFNTKNFADTKKLLLIK